MGQPSVGSQRHQPRTDLTTGKHSSGQRMLGHRYLPRVARVNGLLPPRYILGHESLDASRVYIDASVNEQRAAMRANRIYNSLLEIAK